MRVEEANHRVQIVLECVVQRRDCVGSRCDCGNHCSTLIKIIVIISLTSCVLSRTRSVAPTNCEVRTA